MGFASGLKSLFRREAKSASLIDPSPELLEIFGAIPSITGEGVGPATAMRVPAVACAVGLIAETVGTLPIKLFRHGTKEALPDHPAYRLMHGEANDWTSAEALRIALTADALLHDKGGFALVLRNAAGKPIELHRLAPSQVDPDQDRNTGEPFYMVATTAGRVRYHYADILHVRAFGGSPVTLGRNAIALSIAFEKHIGKVFQNGAQPGGIITSPKRLDEEAKKNLKNAWNDTHSGPKAGGTALLDEGMAYQPVTMTLTDAQFAENRLEQVREIARAFRVPPTMLFELTRGTWSNTEEMARQFLQVTLKPWLKQWAFAYSRCLLTPEERRELYAEFITDDLTTTDTAARAAAYGQYRSMGVMTANEVRAGLNLAPHKDGDTLQNPYTTTAQPAPDQEPQA